MTEQDGVVDGARIDGADAWIDAALADAGRARTGSTKLVRERPWATVLRTPTDDGDVWLKAGGEGTSFEAGLYGVLTQAAPAHVLRPLGINEERAWLLLPDGGTTLQDAAAGDADANVDGLVAAMPAYVELQQALVPKLDALLGLGVADMRPQTLPARFDEALAATHEHAQRADGGEDATVHARLAELRSTVDDWAAELAATPFEATLDHNDLHSENILVGGHATRFYDFGDSVVAHPFTSALVPLTFVRDHVLGRVADDDPRVLRVRDAFLQPFADARGTSVRELVPTLELACRLAKIARTLVWQRALDGYYGLGGPPPQWAGAPLATLGGLLGDSPYGGA